MMLIKRRFGWEFPENKATPETFFLKPATTIRRYH